MKETVLWHGNVVAARHMTDVYSVIIYLMFLNDKSEENWVREKSSAQKWLTELSHETEET